MEEEENKEKSLKEVMMEMNEKLSAVSQKKEKKFKIPFKARVSNRKLKQGYITVEVIGENREIDFVKTPINDGTFRLDGNICAVENFDVFTHKGKPFIHQPKTKINPWNPLKDYLESQRTVMVGDKEITLSRNEIYGQKYVMARMKSDFIKTAKKMGWGVSIFALGIAGIIGYSLLTS